MLEVGINENVRIKEVKKDDNGLLNITFSDSKSGNKKQDTGAVDFIAQLSGEADDDMNYDVNYIVWPVKYDNYVTNMEEALEAFKTIRQKLKHILDQFMTDDEIKWNPMVGITITNPQDTAEIQRVLSNDQTLRVIYNNYVNQFLQMMSTQVTNSELFRVKFTRQSVAKHYASLPKYPPFMEPMTIPAAQSKLKFTNYELEKGLNSGTKVEEDAPAADPVANEEKTAEINSIFSGE